MNDIESGFLSLSDIAQMLRKHWKLGVIAALVLGVFSSAFVILTIRSTYWSDGSLYVRLGKSTLSADPTAGTQSISPQESRHQEVVSVRELIQSRAVAERVVAKLGVQRILDQRSDFEKQITKWMTSVPMFQSEDKAVGEMSPEQVKEQEDMEAAVKFLGWSLRVDNPKDSHLIMVTTKAYDAVLARDLAQAVMDEYQAVHIAAHRPSGSFGFFDRQVEIQRLKVQELESKKRDEMNRRGMMSVESERLLVQTRVTTTTSKLSEVSAALEGQRARLAELNAQIEGQAETMEIEQTGGIANTATDNIKSTVFALEVDHQKAAAVYNSSHPALLQKKRALDEAREMLETQSPEREQHRNVMNPNKLAMELEYAKGLGDIENYESQLSWLQTELSELKLREKELNDDEIYFADLQRQINIAVSEFNAFSTKREQSKVTEAIDRESFSDVNIAQAATLNLKKSGPSRLLLLLACVFASCIFGGACATTRGLFSGDATGYQLSVPASDHHKYEEMRPTNPRAVRPEPKTIVSNEASRNVPYYRVYAGRLRIETSKQVATDSSLASKSTSGASTTSI